MKLDEVSCPFTWDMERVAESADPLLTSAKSDDQHDMVEDIKDDFPEALLMFHLMMVYEQVLSDDLFSVEETLEKAKKVLDGIINNRSTSESMRVALKHIFIGTKCNVYKELNESKDIESLLKETRSEKDMTNKERGVIYGCQCLAWSLYHHDHIGQAIISAATAIEYDPDNGKWHFLLGKTKRKHRRRRHSLVLSPDLVEKRAFEMAWKLSQSALIGVSLAQMYREASDLRKASLIYMQVFQLNPTSCKVRLQLALGFIRVRQYKHAKSCLDYVEARMPNSIIYLHYMAIYHQKCTKDMKTACSFYQRTTEKRNYPAEMDYVMCRKLVDRDFEPLKYLLNLLKKYDNEPKNVFQEINTSIGSCYLFHRQDIVSACKYYKIAIKIDPQSTALTMHRFMVPGRLPINIYEILLQKVDSASQNESGSYNSRQLALFQEIREMCLEHHPRLKKSNLSTNQGSSRDVQSNSSSADVSQTSSTLNEGAPGDHSADGSRNADDLANELSKMGLGHSEKQSE